MIPGKYDLQLKRGDTFYGPLITLPSLASFGGPSTLSGVTVKAQVRKKPADTAAVAEFDVEIVDADARSLRLTLEPADSATIPKGSYSWELQVTSGAWVGTPLAGSVTVLDEITR